MTAMVPPMMPVSVGLAVRRGDELAFVRYAYGPWQGQWTFPSGFVEAGEQPDAAALRETREEAGISAEIEGLISVMTMTWDDTPLLYLVFVARYCGGKLRPDGVEVDDAAFLGLPALEGGTLRFEGQNAWLARRILHGEARLLLPYQSRQWHPTYCTTFA